MDVNDPAAGFGSADASKDPTQHRLWKKYVTFHKASAPKRMWLQQPPAGGDWRGGVPAAALQEACCWPSGGGTSPCCHTAATRQTGSLPPPVCPQGFSSDAAVVDAIAAAAAGAHTVLVLLDSDHSYETVAQELSTYCARFVTVGS